MPLFWRLRDGLATAILWVAYVGMVHAAIEGVVDLLRGEITTLEGARVRAVLPTLADYGVFIGLNAAILIGWALYNWLRFHGPDRRKALRQVAPEAVANHFAVEPDVARAMAGSRRGLLHHDDAGRVIRFEPLPFPEAAPADLAPPSPPAP